MREDISSKGSSMNMAESQNDNSPINSKQADHNTVDDLKVDGGACANNLLMQFQADISGIEVKRPKQIETTGIGAAYLAGLYTGFWKDKAGLARHQQLDRTFAPSMEEEKSQKLLKGWKNAVRCALCLGDDVL